MSPLRNSNSDVPTLNPIPAMIDRCEAWIKVCANLDMYFQKMAKTYQTIVDAETNMHRSLVRIDDISATFTVPGAGGIKDVFLTLKSMHQQNSATIGAGIAGINEDILPVISQLTTDLSRSIADFKNWDIAFKSVKHPTSGATTIDPSLRDKLKLYESAVAACSDKKTPSVDPYVLKLGLDRRIKHVVHKMNRQADSFAYAEDASKNIDAVVSEKIQGIIAQYGEIEGNICRSQAKNVSSIMSGFVNQPRLYEYKHWMASQLAPHAFASDNSHQYVQKCSAREFGYPFEDSIYAIAVKSGSLERRTRVIHSYNGGDYVLTMQSLIEIARGKQLWAVDLLGAELVDDHKSNSKDQFVLRARQHGSRTGRMHTFIFKSENAQSWKEAIAEVLSGQVPESVRQYQEMREREYNMDQQKRDADLEAYSKSLQDQQQEQYEEYDDIKQQPTNLQPIGEVSNRGPDTPYANETPVYESSVSAQYNLTSAKVLLTDLEFSETLESFEDDQQSSFQQQSTYNDAATTINTVDSLDTASILSDISGMSDNEASDSSSEVEYPIVAASTASLQSRKEVNTTEHNIATIFHPSNNGVEEKPTLVFETVFSPAKNVEEKEVEPQNISQTLAWKSERDLKLFQ